MYRVGLFKFENYEDKVRMMNDPMFLFGLKLYDMPDEVEFFDADLCNSLMVSSEYFHGKTLGDCCQSLNHSLMRGGFQSQLLEVGKLKDIQADFDLEKIQVREHASITLRFNNFHETLNAYWILMKTNVMNVRRDHGQGHDDGEAPAMDLYVQFSNPAPYYYDGLFATQIENCLKDKFEGLSHINQVPSNYFKKYKEEMEGK